MDEQKSIQEKLVINSSSNKNRKRRHSGEINVSEEEPAAKFLIEEPPFNLQDFSDEILLKIFQCIDGNSLFSIGRSCYRFYLIVQDYRLWKQIDLTTNQLTVSEIKSRLKWSNNQTEAIKVRGMTETFPSEKWKNVTITENLLTNISKTCENLQILEMHSAYLNLENIKLTDFPCNLKRLVFNNCNVLWPRATPSFFTGMDAHFVCLDELGIEYCNWFEPYDLMVFSKVINLRWLSIKGCNNLKDFVPYGSMSTRFGFRKLQYLDIRETPITDSDVQCFNSVYSLKEILLECPPDLRDTEVEANQRPHMSNQMPSSSRSSHNSLATEPTSANDEPIVSPGNSVNGNERPGGEVNRFVINPNRVLYINLQERRRELEAEGEAGNIPPGPALPVHQVEQHPLIWDMINNRLIERAINFERERPLALSPPRIGPISNRGICSFGRARHPVQNGLVCIRVSARPPDNSFERMTIRHYKLVNDISLSHLVQCSPNLVYLDVTGTSVTKNGVELFQASKPECCVISDHLTTLD